MTVDMAHCRVCGRLFDLRVNGTVRQHGRRDRSCPGSGCAPEGGPAHPTATREDVLREIAAEAARKQVAIDALFGTAADDDDDDDDDEGCDGHESLAGAHMGEAVYCDGTCRTR